MNFNDVASPCINICKIDEPTQRCLGCERTIDEITRWSRLDNDAKQAVMDDLINRHRKAADSTNTQTNELSSENSSEQQNNQERPQQD